MDSARTRSDAPEAAAWWRQILVPVRGGPEAPCRARLAFLLAAASGASVTFLYVVDERVLGDPEAGLVREALEAQLAREGEAVLGAIGRLPEAAGVCYLTRVEVGPVVETILRLARELQADLIVVGAHRRTWLGRLLGQSVAESLLCQAACAVLAVPPTETTPEPAPRP
ncbi:MAG TPA: universal stress protein [Chloroflexota bacterium]|nr:universal stress protein [Chloroflexota bacterium]